MNPMRYKNEKHQSEFEEAIRKKDKKDYAMMAALYLLTADLRLWNLSKRHVGKISINFADIRLKNIHANGYALFCCAKDLWRSYCDGYLKASTPTRVLPEQAIKSVTSSTA